jgi:nitrogen regulatory protein PII
MKRVDLFVNERELNRVIKAIRKAGAPGYSISRHVTGMGPSGGEISEAMDFSSFGANAHVMVFCEEGVVTALSREIRPLLARYGGVAFLSDAEWL